MYDTLWTIAKILSQFIVLFGVYIIAKNHGYSKGYRDGYDRCKQIVKKF